MGDKKVTNEKNYSESSAKSFYSSKLTTPTYYK